MGLPPNQVWLHEAAAFWPAVFASEKERILAAIGSRVRELEHVGSTAVPGIRAKPILDMLLGVSELEHGLSLQPLLAPLGYRYLQIQPVAGHHIYGKGQLTHLLHVVRHLGPEWQRLIRFRDHLRQHRDVATRYEKEKIRLSSLYPQDRSAYSAAKEPLVDQILSEIS